MDDPLLTQPSGPVAESPPGQALTRPSRPWSANNPERVFLYESQKRALEELMSGMDADARWVLLVGPEGIGKSVVLQVLLAELRATDADVVTCDGAEVADADRLLTVLRGQLELSRGGRNPRRLRAEILASRRVSRRPLAILVDNAHVLSSQSLKALANLAAATPEDKGAVCVVLVGRSSLEEPALRAAPEAKRVRCRLAPLNAIEIRQHIERRLHAGDDDAPVVSEAAIEELAKYGRGRPGLLNSLCDVVTQRPSARLTNQISVDTVREAAEQLGLEPTRNLGARTPAGGTEAPPPPTAHDERRRRLQRLMVVFTGALVMGGVAVYIAPTLMRAMDGVAWRWSAPPVTPPAPAPEATARPRPGRRDAAAAAVARQGAERRSVALERAPKAPAPERAEPPKPPPVSPEQIAALMAGARAGQTADISRLLASGVSPNVRDAAGFTPLMRAVLQGQASAASVLLDGGAEVNARDRGGITSTMLAVINDHPDVLQVLLGRGADVNARSGTGWTALTFAAWKGDPDLVRMLLRHGANPSVVDKQGWSPLDYATAALRSSSGDAEPPSVDPDVPAVTQGTRHIEVIPLLQRGTGY